MLPMPMRMLVLAIAGWVNQERRELIEYLREEVRVLRELRTARHVAASTP